MDFDDMTEEELAHEVTWAIGYQDGAGDGARGRSSRVRYRRAVEAFIAHQEARAIGADEHTNPAPGTLAAKWSSEAGRAEARHRAVAARNAIRRASRILATLSAREGRG